MVLGYGCQYQGGYVFSIDDTTPTTSSIGGTVAATADGPYFGGVGVTSVNWSSGTSVSIWGIAETSTIGSPIPNTTTPTGETALLATGQLNCNGNIDGSCDTNNIIIHYPYPAMTTEAAAVCKQTTGALAGYSDWYLPSICEMGFDTTGVPGSRCGVPPTPPAIQNMQINLVDRLDLLHGSYWSSTEFSGDPSSKAWLQYFTNAVPEDSNQNPVNKVVTYSVRCARALSL